MTVAMTNALERSNIIEGTLLGQMIGDTLGLPWEGVAPNFIPKDITKHSLIFGKRMVSDDSEHAFFTILAIWKALENSEPPIAFRKQLRKYLAGWVLAGPPSLGKATLKASLKAVIGLPDSGVRSKGNGPLMRAPVIGAAIADQSLRHQLADISTEVTHLDPVVSDCARMAADAVNAASQGICAEEWITNNKAQHFLVQNHFDELLRHIKRGKNVKSYASIAIPNQKQGIPGTSLLTLLIAVKCWDEHKDNLEGAVREAISLGGDTDTVGALVGAFVGAYGGPTKTPKHLLAGITDVYSVKKMKAAAKGQAEGKMPSYAVRLVRNSVQFSIVVAHGTAIRPIRKYFL